MEPSHFLVAYYLGLLVFVGNFFVMYRMIRTFKETKKIEKRVVQLLLYRKRRR